MAKNIVISPHEPQDLKAKASKMLSILSKGGSISRKNCDVHEVAEHNDSIHSIVSHIRHKLHVPIMSTRQPPDKQVVTYLMAPEEIVRFNDPTGREIQKQEMIQETTIKRKMKLLKTCQVFVQAELRRKKEFQDKDFLNHFNLEKFS